MSEPRSLFKMTFNDIAVTLASPYDVHPDGQRFLVNTPEPLLFVQGLEALLK